MAQCTTMTIDGLEAQVEQIKTFMVEALESMRHKQSSVELERKVREDLLIQEEDTHSKQITLCQEDMKTLDKALQHLESAFSEVRQCEQYSATQIKRILAHSERCKLEEARMMQKIEARMIQKIASLEDVVAAMKENGSRAAEEQEEMPMQLDMLNENLDVMQFAIEKHFLQRDAEDVVGEGGEKQQSDASFEPTDTES